MTSRSVQIVVDDLDQLPTVQALQVVRVPRPVRLGGIEPPITSSSCARSKA